MQTYAATIFFVLFSAMFGYLVVSIGQLSQAEPSTLAADAKIAEYSLPTLNTASFSTLSSLTNRGVTVSSSFDATRCNPFDDPSSSTSANCVYQAAHELALVLFAKDAGRDTIATKFADVLSTCTDPKATASISYNLGSTKLKDEKNPSATAYLTTVNLDSPRSVYIWADSNPLNRQLADYSDSYTHLILHCGGTFEFKR